MTITIVNPSALTFNESVGISNERASELSDMLDAMSARLKGQTVRTCYLFEEIAAMCNNLEEVIYCTVNHCNYMAINHGIFLCPTQKKK